MLRNENETEEENEETQSQNSKNNNLKPSDDVIKRLFELLNMSKSQLEKGLKTHFRREVREFKDYPEPEGKVDYKPFEEQSEENEEIVSKGSRNKEAGKPVFSQYSQIRFDIYDIFHRYTEEYAALYGLQDMNRENSKQYKSAKGAAVALCVQFFSKANAQFPETMSNMRSKDRAVKGEEYIKEHGDIVENYYTLMNRITHGVLVDEKKQKYDRYIPNLRQLSFITNFMAHFMHESGIGAIEGRYKDEKNEFGYGG